MSKNDYSCATNRLKLTKKLFGGMWFLLHVTVWILVGYMDNHSAPGKGASVWSNMLRPFLTSQR